MEKTTEKVKATTIVLNAKTERIVVDETVESSS